ncbi:hypothetical protein AYI68_g1275 [Smittium mucronatum]|uniref:Uncharacterized protein n=1 Tax=Smittium mucronatum TaxID=133383 RepID=A0A1R0H5U9_9FUNG|nr:hypothetical protein AYI68_g1275 [Smittium mucronatum]
MFVCTEPSSQTKQADCSDRISPVSRDLWRTEIDLNDYNVNISNMVSRSDVSLSVPVSSEKRNNNSGSKKWRFPTL